MRSSSSESPGFLLEFGSFSLSLRPLPPPPLVPSSSSSPRRLPELPCWLRFLDFGSFNLSLSPFPPPYVPSPSSPSRLAELSCLDGFLNFPVPCPDILLELSSSGVKLVSTRTSPDLTPARGTQVGPELGSKDLSNRSATGRRALPNGLSFPSLSWSNTFSSTSVG